MMDQPIYCPVCGIALSFNPAEPYCGCPDEAEGAEEGD